MKQTVFWALVALNALLLATLIAPYLRSNTAMAQRGGGRRPDILMIPGEVQGGNSAVVYLIDTANRRLGAIMLNSKGKGLDAMAPQPLDRVFDDRAADNGNNKGNQKGGRKP